MCFRNAAPDKHKVLCDCLQSFRNSVLILCINVLQLALAVRCVSKQKPNLQVSWIHVCSSGNSCYRNAIINVSNQTCMYISLLMEAGLWCWGVVCAEECGSLVAASKPKLCCCAPERLLLGMDSVGVGWNVLLVSMLLTCLVQKKCWHEKYKYIVDMLGYICLGIVGSCAVVQQQL